MNQPQKDKSPRIVIYARYSDTNQRETSIDDQIRLSKETAIHKGLGTDNITIYSDSAISGQAHTFKKREGRKQLESAWDNNEFDVIILDAFERLARDRLEQAVIIDRLMKNRRVRLLTADGIDSHQVGWESLRSASRVYHLN